MAKSRLFRFLAWSSCCRSRNCRPLITMPQFMWLLGMVYLYISTFMFFLPWLCSDLGFSVYYTKAGNTIDRLEEVNKARTAEAEAFLASAPQITKSKRWKVRQDRSLQFGFIVVSVKRKSDPHYLLQVVSRLMAQTLQDKSVRTETVVLNVDVDPARNKDAEVLSRHVTVLDEKSVFMQQNKTLIYDEINGNIFEKEKQDYIFALEIAMDLGAKYTVIIEDDALPDYNIIEKLKHITARKIPASWLKSGNDWAFVKLYYPEKWQGFGNTEINELIFLFIAGGGIPVLVLLKCIGSRNIRMMVFLFFASGLYITAFVYGFGRAHLLELRKVSPFFYTVSKAPGCCTPAVLYPRTFLPNLASFLRTKECSKSYPLDFAIDEFAKTFKLQKLYDVAYCNTFSNPEVLVTAIDACWRFDTEPMRETPFSTCPNAQNQPISEKALKWMSPEPPL